MITAQRNRPNTLSEVYGQKDTVSFLQSVLRKPEISPRNYSLIGPMGVGKTSTVRAFASDLTGEKDILNSPNYLELDSSFLSSKSQVENLLPYIFSDVPGWKVVLFDESHTIDPSIQTQLLKPLDDFTGNIFFFFATTEDGGMIEPLASRCYPFTLRAFTEAEQMDFLNKALEAEGIQASEQYKKLAVSVAGGHLRDLLNQVDALRVRGEESYLEAHGRLPQAIRAYFLSPGTESIEALAQFPFAIVRRSIDRFLRVEVIGGKKHFRSGEIGKVYLTYLRFKTLIKTDDDFYSMLFLWKESFEGSLAPRPHGV